VKKIIFILIPSAVLFLSCSYSGACYNNLKGIYASENGDYGKSVIYFKKAMQHSNSADYITYNISSVYRDMGEKEAATDTLLEITGNAVDEILYRKNYLKAVISYNEGRFSDAVDFFKKSVIIDNSDINLIKGLELAYMQIENRTTGGESVQSISDITASGNTDGEDSQIGSDLIQDNGEKEQSSEESSNINEGENFYQGRILDYMFAEEVPLWLEYGENSSENIPDW
jgi:tetratricopeptide (TPR) repeat protein